MWIVIGTNGSRLFRLWVTQNSNWSYLNYRKLITSQSKCLAVGCSELNSATQWSILVTQSLVSEAIVSAMPLENSLQRLNRPLCSRLHWPPSEVSVCRKRPWLWQERVTGTNVEGRSRKAALNGYSALTYIKMYPCYMHLRARMRACIHERVCRAWVHVCVPVSTPICMCLCPWYVCPSACAPAWAYVHV